MKPIFLTIFALCCLFPVRAQRDSLINRELTLEKEYNPTIHDAVKISQLPELREPQAPESPVEFAYYENPYQVQSKPFPLSPQAYLTHLNYSKYRGYLTGGLSSLIDIDGDIGYRILNSTQEQSNIFFSHRSSRCDVSYLQENGRQKFKINDNWGGLDYRQDYGAVKFLADTKYTYSGFNYYGLSIPYFMSGFQPDKNTNQINGLFEAHASVSSEKTYPLNYKINVGYTNFRQKYGNTLWESGSGENRVLIDGDVRKIINSTKRIGLSGSIKTYSYTTTLFKLLNDGTTNYWTFSLNPYIYWESSNWNFLLGAKMEVEVGGLGKIIASPVIRFNYYQDQVFMFYLLADGGRKDNSQYNLFYENRYVDPLIRVMDSRSPLDATAGIKFTPLSTASVGIFTGYTIMKDEHFFYSNAGAKNNFGESASMLAGNWITPSYEDANTFKLGGDLKYAFQNVFELNLKGTYYHRAIMKKYPNDGFLHGAWNKPDFEMNLNAAYYYPELPLRFDLSYLGAYGRKAAGESRLFGTILKMNDINDLSVKGTYSFTPDFSCYVSLNNLLFSKYDFWWGYPTQSFNIMGGINILF